MSISWYPLAASDPVPGDPWVVKQGGVHYGEVAEAISEASVNLATIAELDGMQSEAVAEIRTKAQKVADQIIAAKDRYTEVSGALTSYGTTLTTTQADALDLLRRARLAQERIDEAGTADYLANAALDNAAPADQLARQADVLSARSESTSAAAALVSLRGDLEVVKQSRDTAAQAAMDRISGVVGSDDLNDGWWANWGSKIAHAVSEIAGAIAGIAGILSLVLCWVPVLGQALAAVALIASAVALLADLVLALAGEGSWKTVIVGALGFLTLGVGKVVGSSLKLATGAAKGRALMKAASLQAKTGNPARTASSLVGGGIAKLSPHDARLLVQAAKSPEKLLGAARPGSIMSGTVKDLSGGWKYLTSGVFRAESNAAQHALMGQLDSPVLKGLALLGHGESAVNLQQLSAMSDDVMRGAPALAEALQAVDASANAVGLLGAKRVMGVTQGIWGYGSGIVDYVVDGPAPSAAQKLNLR